MNVQNIPKSKKMTKMHLAQQQQPQELLKWSKYQGNLKNKRNTPKNFENDQNTTKLSQNTFDCLDFWGILVDFKLLGSF